MDSGIVNRNVGILPPEYQYRSFRNSGIMQPDWRFKNTRNTHSSIALLPSEFFDEKIKPSFKSIKMPKITVTVNKTVEI